MQDGKVNSVSGGDFLVFLTLMNSGPSAMHMFVMMSLLLVMQDGKANSATVVGAFLVFLRLMDNASSAMHMFSARRSPPSITPSQKRSVCGLFFLIRNHSTLLVLSVLILTLLRS